MTEQSNHEQIVDMKISEILNDAEQRIFERLDALHKRGIHDNDVITYLRKQGEHDLAERYMEWGEIVDPDGEDTTSYDAPVPDPIDAPSYQVLRTLAGVQAFQLEAERIIPGTTDGFLHLVERLDLENRHRILTDPQFKNTATRIGRFLDQLEEIHQLGDSERAGFLLAAYLDASTPGMETFGQ